jgi:hypothetical protein
MLLHELLAKESVVSEGFN